MQLSQLLQAYAENHDIERESLKPMRAAIRSFSLHLGSDARLGHLSPGTINAWLADEVERVQRRTAKNYRACLLTLWRWAYEEEELIDNAPRKVRTIKAPLPPVEAYTPDEVERLLAACDVLSNRFCKMRVQRKLLYRALILVGWHTGFRPNDVVRLRWSAIGEDGSVRIVQHKTGREVVRWIDRDALGACEAIRFDDVPEVFAQFVTLSAWRRVHRKLKAIAGVKRGTPKWIRRALGTVIAKRYGEAAAGQALGHVTPGLARKHYIDASQLPRPELRPPRLRRRKFKAG